MGRSPSLKMGLRKGQWTSEEDQKLVAYIEEHGHASWRTLPHKAGLQRCGKSCRLRWRNYLRPDIKRGKFSSQEEQTIMQLHALLGNRWSAIATHLARRTDNEIKNHWNTHLKKRLTKMGIDPVTHKSISATTNLSHITQWESARLEAEARLVRQSTLVIDSYQRIHNDAYPFINKTQIQPFLQTQPICLEVLKQYDSKGPQPPILTSRVNENTISPLPNVCNQVMPSTYLIESTEPSFIEEATLNISMNDCELLTETSNTLNIPNEANMLGVDNIMYQDNYLIKASTYPTSNNASNGIFGNYNNYWCPILGKLENDSPFSPIL